MSILISFLVSLVLAVVSELLRPKPDIEDAKASGLGDFNFPTVSEARPVPCVWGLVELKAPNVIWYGDLEVVPIKKKIKTGWFSDKKVTIGYKYYIGMHAALCSGKSVMEAIFFDERSLWEGTADSDTSYEINEPNFHKGDDAGGVTGTFSFKPGDPNVSTQNNYLLNIVSPEYPDHYGTTAVIFEHMYIGNSSTLLRMSFFVRRLPIAPSAAYADIGGYANAANMIYEIVTNKDWGAALSASLIGMDSFNEVAETLYDEDFGLSLQWDNRKSYEDLIEEILRHVDGVLYYDILTGLFKLKLLRPDYTPAALPLFDESNIITLTECSKPSYEETANELHVVYYDAVARKERTVVAHDTGNLQMQGAIISIEKKYIGICTHDVAGRVAIRDMNVLAAPVLKVSFYCDRDAFNLTPGDPFRFSWADRGITEAVLRVIEIDLGSLTDSRIYIDAVEDVSSGNATIYDSSGTSGAAVYDDSPVDIVTYLQIEAPYALRSILGYVEASAEEADMATQLYLAVAPSNYSKGYDFYDKYSNSHALHVDDNGFAPTAIIYEAPGLVQEFSTSSFTVEIESGLSLWEEEDANARELSGLLYCDGEFMSYETSTITGGVYITFNNIHRGLLDTVPAVHSSIGTRIWSVQWAAQLSKRCPAAGGTVTTVAQPESTGGTLDLALCTPRLITFDSRGLKPYPPGNWRLENEYYPVNFTGDLSVSWNHRNRKLNTIETWYQTDTDVGAAEAGTTYELKFYNTSGGGLLRTESGLTGLSYTYTEADQLADNGGVTLPPGLRVTLTSSRDGYTCLQTHDWTTARS